MVGGPARAGDRRADDAAGAGRAFRPEVGRAGGPGIEHTNATGPAGQAARGTRTSARGRGSVWIVVPDASNAIVTDPSRSVRRTRAPAAARRSSVDFAGCPYGLPAPADATAMRGRTASTKACVVAVLEPWCATLSRSTCGSPDASRLGSMSCSTSPASRNRRRSTCPSSTIETLLMPVPPSGGVRGTRPRTGHSTRRSISSTASRSPAAREPSPGAPGRPSRSAQAAYPGPGPIIPGSNTRPTRYRSSNWARPAT